MFERVGLLLRVVTEGSIFTHCMVQVVDDYESRESKKKYVNVLQPRFIPKGCVVIQGGGCWPQCSQTTPFRSMVTHFSNVAWVLLDPGMTPHGEGELAVCRVREVVGVGLACGHPGYLGVVDGHRLEVPRETAVRALEHHQGHGEVVDDQALVVPATLHCNVVRVAMIMIV